ncbi:MAG: hypothetical protein ACR2N6_04745 [Miltoncostaeaceae bacterium]
MSASEIEVDGTTYALDPQPVRASLTDDPNAMWGFAVHVLVDGQLVGVKTCFVGRLGIELAEPEALTLPIDQLTPVLHRKAFEKIEERLREGEPGDELLFA